MRTHSSPTSEAVKSFESRLAGQVVTTKSILVTAFLLSVASSAAGQSAFVTAITRPSDGASLDATRVAVRVPFGAIESEPLEVGLALDQFDEIRTVSGADSVDVVIECVDGGQILLSGTFRALIQVGSEGQSCAINLSSGAASMQSEDPTEVQVGETTLGPRHTHYAVRVFRARREPANRVLVFDGEVLLRSAGRDLDTITAGSARTTVGRTVTADRLTSRQIASVAALHARADLARAVVATEDRGSDLRSLQAAYRAVLMAPAEVEPRVALAEEQFRLQVAAPGVLYQLDRAQAIGLETDKDRASVSVMRGAVYLQQGDSAGAEEQFEQAREIDAELTDRLVSTYVLTRPLDPAVRFQPGVSRVALREMTVSVQARPASVAVGRQTHIVAQVIASGGGAVQDADVRISFGGGRFRESSTRELTGRTNEDGVFQGDWSCDPCAAAYLFSAEVTKPGYRNARAEARVRIRR